MSARHEYVWIFCWQKRNIKKIEIMYKALISIINKALSTTLAYFLPLLTAALITKYKIQNIHIGGKSKLTINRNHPITDLLSFHSSLSSYSFF